MLPFMSSQWLFSNAESVFIDNTMGLFQCCLAKNNNVEVEVKEEIKAYEKVIRAMVTEDMTKKRGGVALDLAFLSDETPKMPPPKMIENKKEDFEKRMATQGKVQTEKQKMAQQRRDEARV